MNQPRESPSRNYAVLLGLIVMAGTAVRVYGLGRRSVWDDEAWTYFISSQGWEHLWASVPYDIHPPLFYIVEAVSLRWLGHSEAALRLPALVAGVLLLLVLAMIARRLWGEAAALLVALFAGLSPVLIYQSQEARNYSLLCLVMLLGAWSWWQYAQSLDRRQAVAAALLTLAAVCTHYLGVLLIPFAFLALAAHQRLRTSAAWIAFISGSSPALIALFLDRFMKQQAEITSQISGIQFLAQQPWPLAVVRSGLILGPGNQAGWIKLAGYTLFGLGVLLVAILWLRSRSQSRGLGFPAWLAGLILSCVWAGTILGLWPLRDSYSGAAAPAVYLLMAGAVSQFRDGYWRVVVTSLILLSMGLGVASQLQDASYANADYRGLAREVSATPADGLVLARGWGDLGCYGFYDARALPMAVHGIDGPADMTPEAYVVGRTLMSTDDLLGQSRRIWLIGKATAQAQLRDLAQRLTDSGYVSSRRVLRPGVEASYWERHETAAGER